jgi:hypothetical protein
MPPFEFEHIPVPKDVYYNQRPVPVNAKGHLINTSRISQLSPPRPQSENLVQITH